MVCAICNTDDHNLTFKDCPKWQFEQKVIKLAREKKISPRLARDELKGAQGTETFADKVKTAVATTPTQIAPLPKPTKSDMIHILREMMHKDPSFIQELKSLIVAEHQKLTPKPAPQNVAEHSQTRTPAKASTLQATKPHEQINDNGTVHQDQEVVNITTSQDEQMDQEVDDSDSQSDSSERSQVSKENESLQPRSRSSSSIRKPE